MNKDNLDNDDNATTRTTTMISHICPSAVGCILDNTSNTLDGKDENVCEPMDIDDDDNDKGNATGLLPIDNPHKTNYREQYILRDNWQRGRYKHIRFPGHVSPTGQGVVTCLQFDDDKIITGVDDRVINIYATKTGQHLSTLRGHEGGVWALQYVGNTLVSGTLQERDIFFFYFTKSALHSRFYRPNDPSVGPCTGSVYACLFGP
jgi:WD40 repeat protein